jgi:hypothetical protein
VVGVEVLLTVNLGVSVSVSTAEQLAGAPFVYVRPTPTGPLRQVKISPAGLVTVAVFTVCANS